MGALEAPDVITASRVARRRASAVESAEMSTDVKRAS
jgi:hypothetical protein